MSDYASDTETQCDYCGELVDHRSQILRRQGQRTIRKCINCGHEQACTEFIMSVESAKYVFFLDKLMTFDPNKVDKEDIEKCGWLRDMLSEKGYLPIQYLGEFRRLQRKYDTEI